MAYKKGFSKVASLIMCFIVFFSFGSTVNAAVQWDFASVYNWAISGLTDAIVGFGDGVIHIVTASIGESVTIDRLVYNDVKKVSIDYWDDIDGSGDSATQKPIKAFMQPVVERWYAVFYKIAIMVYMIVLVYIGVQIMFSSTAQKKAGYKELFMTWVIGITILFMFPYVMKYIILVNNAMVKTLQAKSMENGYSLQQSSGKLAEMNFWEAAPMYGTDDFVGLLGGSKETDMMVLTREAARRNSETGNADIALAVIYLILIGQMIAILIMYYKRAFMIAFLITIFPLVAMTYVLDKIGDGKNQSFGIWFKEFVVNVVVQIFHAVVYLLITGAGIKTYLSSGGKNFVFMLLCVLFLFEGEKILRNIFNINSKAKTMADLATAGAFMFSAAGKTKGLFKKGSNNVATADDARDVNAASSRVGKRRDKAKEDNMAAVEALDEKRATGGTGKSDGEYLGEDREPAGVRTPQYDGQNARDTALMHSMKRRLNSGVLTGAVKMYSGAVGATLETGRVLADGKTKPGEVIGAITGGSKLGQTIANPISMAANKMEQKHHAKKMEKAILSGSMDKELGLDNINVLPVGPIADENGNLIDPAKLKAKLDTKQAIYRKALAAYAKKAATKGGAQADIAYFEFLEENLK